MSVRFSGSTSNYLRRSTDLHDFTSNYTISFWFYISSDTNAYANLFYYGDNSTTTADSLQMGSDGTTLNVWVQPSEANGTNLSTTTWYNIAVIRASVTDLKVYLNGALDITGPSVNVTGRGTNSLSLGAWRAGNAGAADPFNGRIGNFKMWTTNLAQPEIEQEMWSYMPIRTANLYNWTPFIDTSSGLDFLDYSGNGRNWTETGTVTFEDNPPVSWRRGRQRYFVASSGVAPRRWLLGAH